MKIKRYFAADMRQALQKVREEQGPDAVILSNRKVNGGVEIVAALDYDPAVIERLADDERVPGTEPPPRSQPKAARAEAAVHGTTPPPAQENRPQGTKQVVWSQDPAIAAMRDEMKTLRSLLETQLSGFAWSEVKLRQPQRAQLLQRLMRLGLAPRLCRELIDEFRLEGDPEHNWRQALGRLSRRIPVTGDDVLTGVVALVGPTGVGKTTTVAKLAARFALRFGAGRLALISTDNFRIGAQQQLRTYGRILGAPVLVAEDAESLAATLASLRDKQLVLIDTAGMSQRDVRLAEQITLLKTSQTRVRTFAVLSTAAQRAVLDETLHVLGNTRIDGCVLTKLDETASLGEAISVVVRHRIPVAYVCDGQRVPEDLHPARANSLVTRSVALTERTEMPGDETMAFALQQQDERLA